MNNNELLVIYTLATIAQILITFCCYYFQNKKILKLQTDISNHHQFLLKVKNDLPILWTKTEELAVQILPPPEHQIH